MQEHNQRALEKIRIAKGLYRKFSREMASIPGFPQLLDEYKMEIEKSRILMEELGLPEICLRFGQASGAPCSFTPFAIGLTAKHWPLSVRQRPVLCG